MAVNCDVVSPANCSAVKLLTCLFVPIDNTFVYSGGLGLSAPLRL